MRVLVTGAGGQVGSAVVEELTRRSDSRRRGSLDVFGADHSKLDITDRDAVVGLITELSPHVVVHPAAFTAVDRCESESDLAYATNTIGTRHVAEDGTRLAGAHVTYVSTDYVFDGTSPQPYTEWDDTNPLSVYGRSKLGGERELDPGATIVRTSWVCGRAGSNMVKTAMRLSAGTGALRFVDDQKGSPTVAEDLAVTLVELALARRPGIHHVTNSGATTWFELVRAVIGFAGGDPDRVEPISTSELDPPLAARRPANSVLDNRAVRLLGLPALPDWRESTEALVKSLLAAS